MWPSCVPGRFSYVKLFIIGKDFKCQVPLRSEMGEAAQGEVLAGRELDLREKWLWDVRRALS